MKKAFLFFFVILMGASGFSQIHILEYTGYNAESRPALTLSGTVYLNNEFSKGKILDTEKATWQEAWLRYNVLEDLVEVKLDLDAEPKVLPKLPNLTYHFEDHNLAFKSLKKASGEKVEGYFLEYFTNDKISFFAKPLVSAQRIENHADHSYAPNFGKRGYELGVANTYYIKKEGQMHEIALQNRDIRILFSNKKEVKTFLEKNKIKTVEDVIKFLQFYTGQPSLQ